MRLVFGKIRLFQLNGIEVGLHWSYLLSPFGSFLWFGWMRGQAEGVFFAFGILIIAAISCLFHEYCHCLAARICSYQKKISILLIPFGAVALFENIPDELPLKEIVIALAGPVGSAIFGGIAWLVALTTETHLMSSGIIGYHTSKFLYFLATINFLIAIFNIILFIFPADGGRLCRAILHGILRRYSSLDASSAHLLATKLVVRGGWFASLIIICVMIYTSFMTPLFFILLPLLCIAGEAELFALKENYHLLEFEPTEEKSQAIAVYGDNTLLD